MSTFTTQNKTRPGVYVNFESMASNLNSVADRGIVVLPLELDFLPADCVTTIDVYTDCLEEFGVSINDDRMLPIREALKNAETVLVYRIDSVTDDEFVADDEDDQDVSENSDAETDENSDVLDISNSISEVDCYEPFFKAIATEEFNTMAILTNDSAVKARALAFVKDMRENQGVKIQVVMPNYSLADYEGVISVCNGVVLDDGTEISTIMACAYIAGAIAGANINESLTYSAYSGAVDIYPKYTNTEIVGKLEEGHIIFTAKRGKVIIEQDINTFTSYSATKSNVFSKNRVIRVIDNIAGDIKTLFEDYYLGKISNNETGRSLFAAECISYLRKLEDIDCIQKFDAIEDVTIAQGDDIDAVVVGLNIWPVDSIEKLYMTVVLN